MGKKYSGIRVGQARYRAPFPRSDAGCCYLWEILWLQLQVGVMKL